jgi:hypothetical protein
VKTERAARNAGAVVVGDVVAARRGSSRESTHSKSRTTATMPTRPRRSRRRRRVNRVARRAMKRTEIPTSWSQPKGTTRGKKRVVAAVAVVVAAAAVPQQVRVRLARPQ